MSYFFRSLLTAAALMVIITACGSETATTEIASDDVSEAESTSDTAAEVASDPAEAVEAEVEVEVESTTTTVAAALVDDTVEPEAVIEVPEVEEAEAFVPEPGPGLGAFAVKVFQTGELGLTPTEQGCIDGRLAAEVRIDRTEDFDTLDIEQQAKSIEILLDCAGGRLESEFLNEFEVTEEMESLGLGEDFGSCIFREMSRDDDDQPLTLLALTHAIADEPAPEETIDVGSRMFARCIDVSALLIDSFEEDPAAASFMDFDCLRTEIDEDAGAALFASVFRDPDGADPTNMANGFEAFRPCLRFGQLMADQFAGNVQFSAAEISCIDEAFSTDEIFEAMMAGTDLPPSALDGMIGCLEPETLIALNG